MADRRAFLSVSAAAAVAAPLLGAEAAAAGGRSGPRPQAPGRELRDILREIDPRRIEATVRRLVAFGTRHTLSTQDDPVRGIGAARDWIFDEMLAVRRGLRRPDDGREAVVHPARLAPDPGTHDRSPTSSPRCAATVARPDLRGDRPLRLAGHRRHERHQRRARRRRRRLRRGRRAWSWPGSWPTRHTEATIVFAAVAGEEQGLYGSAIMAQQYYARRRRRAGHVQQRHRRHQQRATTAPGPTRARCGCSSRACRPSETPAQADDPAVGRRRERRAVPPARPVRRVTSPTTTQTGMNVRVIWRRDRYLRGSDHISFLHAGLPGRPVHRAAGELRPRAPGRPGRERRAVRRPRRVLRLRLHRPGRPGQRRRRCGRWPRARARRTASRILTTAADQRQRRCAGSAGTRARPGRLRGAVARDHRAGLDPRHRRRRRHRRSPSTCPRTTSSSASAPSTRDGHRSPVAAPLP